MGAIRLRRATISDAPELCRIHQNAVRTKARSHYSPELIEAWIGNREPRLYMRAMEQGELVWVAEHDGWQVGFASLKGHELNALYATAQAPRGTGTALLHAVIAEAKALGQKHLAATCSLNAVAFYLRSGFEDIGPAELVRSGAVIPAIRMRKDI